MNWFKVGEALKNQADALDEEQQRQTGRGYVLRALGEAIHAGVADLGPEQPFDSDHLPF